MARNLTPKSKQLRRFGLASTKRKSVAKRKTLHGERIEEKQKIKFLYGVMERQFRRYIENARKAPGNAIDNIIQQLERRLDNAVYRAGLAKTRQHARQLVSHRHVMINSKILDIPSYQIKTGDIISIKPATFQDSTYQKMLAERQAAETPSWIKKVENNKANILRLPVQDDQHEQADYTMIFESYR